MKKILLIIGFVLITLTGFAQSGTGWAQQRSKVNFKDSINIAKGWMIDGTIVLPSVTKINFLNDVTGLIQAQINLKADLASPTFTGTVTIPSPFTIGTTSVTTSGTELNYLDNVTGTTGTGKLVLDNAPTITGHPTVEGVTATGATGTGNLVFSASPTLTGTVTLPTATSIGDVSSTEIGYVNGVTGAIQTQLDARKYMPYDFLIEEVAGTTYARPNPNTAYTATSNAVPSVVINSVMGQLTAGGIIQFAAGTFDNCDSIVVPYDNITWRGSGRNKTILKLKASFDAGKKVSDGFIQVIEKDYFTILDMEIDGNGANQTKIDDGGSAGLAIICGIETEDTQYTTIDNCYIHDFTETGVFSSGCDFLTIKNSHIKDNYWNGVTFGWGTDFNVVENCLVEGGGDVGVALYGRNNKILGSTIRYVTGTHGYDNSQVSISLEAAGDDPYVRSQYHQILNNMIKGAGQNAGIVSNAIGEGSLGVVISNNYIDSCGVAISMMGDSSLIANNKIVNPQGESYNYGIYIQDGDYNFVTGNDITCRTIGSGDYPIMITNTSDGADYNKIVNNNLFGGTYYSIGVGHANCDGNYIAGNIFNDSQGGATDIYDVGTGTIKTYDNYDYNSSRFNPITTGSGRAVTYTGDAVSVDFGAADLTTTGATTTGTLSTEVLQVGDATSSTILSLDSLSTDGTTYSLYDGATQLAPNIPASGAGELGDYAKLLVDTIGIYSFGAGSGADADSILFEINDNEFGAYYNYTDTLYVVNFKNIKISANDSLKFNCYYGNYMTGVAVDSLFNAPEPVGDNQGILTPDNFKIPPDSDVWIGISGAQITGKRPKEWILQMNGYLIRDH